MQLIMLWAITSFYMWWFGRGWLSQADEVRLQLMRLSDTFSVVELMRTLFSPFRQLSSGSLSGPIAEVMRSIIDKLVSRFIGAFIRCVVIVIGLVVILLTIVIGAIRLCIWPLLPLMPLIGIGLWLSGWTPSW